MNINLTNFTFMDGLKVTLPSIIIVILILVILSFVISFFKYLPKDKVVEQPRKTQKLKTKNDKEEEMVAMLMASIIAKEEFSGDIKIKSIKRIK